MPTAKKSALAIRHVHFEALGNFASELAAAGYEYGYADVGYGQLLGLDPLKPDLLIILGGPIGVYETETYPFLADELSLIKARLEAGRPILGVCLGAQLIAAALGAKVAPARIKEIGFAPLTLTDAGMRSPLRHLAGVAVLHWHGDAFEIPRRAELLALTVIAKQAFSIGANVLALQFHPEIDPINDLEPWLIGHAVELANAGISPDRIRAEVRALGTDLKKAGQAMFAEWLSNLSRG